MRKVGLSDLFLSDYMSADGVKIWSTGGIDAYTKLMLHMDGADSSTTFTDSEMTPKTVTRYGDAHIDTAQSKFGGSSAYFDGAGDYLFLPGSSDFDFGVGGFTVDMWVRFSVYPATTGTTQFDMLYSRWIGTPIRTLYMGVWNDVGVYKATIACYNTSAVFDFSDNWAFSLNTWYHIAWVRSGNTIRFYVDGTQVGTDHTTAGNVDVMPTSTPVFIGIFQSALYYHNGYIDELRISKGIARWTANFTPPGSPYSL